MTLPVDCLNDIDDMTMTNDEKHVIYKQWVKPGCRGPYPYECRDITCGARTRAGTPCKQKAIYSSGRCKFHGGLSTGPRTAEEKAKSALNGIYKPDVTDKV
jgi:hypothetical protein